MHSLLNKLEVAETDSPERRVIRLEGPCPQAGIAAALRRAFDNPMPRQDAGEDEFDLLLARLH